MLLYAATVDTLLKKSPAQGSTLPDDQKVIVPKGKTYKVEKVLDTDGLHSQLQLAHGAGNWWVFNPHFSPTNDQEASVAVPAVSQEVTAVFTLDQAKQSSIIYGTLVFYQGTKEILKVVATSGARGFQYAGAHTIRGKGCIPPAKDWKISTAGYWLNTKGVEGMFYHITPDPRFGRGELGLHRDSNNSTSPGSAGCVVLKDSNVFNTKVVPLLNSLKGKQSHVNLSVIYT